jgi:hypothetical protein
MCLEFSKGDLHQVEDFWCYFDFVFFFHWTHQNIFVFQQYLFWNYVQIEYMLIFKM